MTDNKPQPVAQFVKQDVAPLNILLFVADACNFKCEYCYNKMPRHGTFADVDLLVKFVKDAYDKTHKKMNLSLIGGEPMLHPQIEELCSRLQEVPDSQVEVLTNFSLPLDRYIRLLKKGMCIAASWHSSPFDKSNIDYYKKMVSIPMHYFKSSQIEIRIMFEFDNWQNSVKMYKLFYPTYKRWLEISLLTKNDGSLYKYSDEQIEEYHEYVKQLKYTREFFTVRYSDGTEKLVSFNDLYLNESVNFHLWKCNAGLDYIYVHADGNVYNCQSYYEHYINPICNIKQTEGKYIKELFKPCICRVDYCSCDFDVKKEKILKNVK